MRASVARQGRHNQRAASSKLKPPNSDARRGFALQRAGAALCGGSRPATAAHELRLLGALARRRGPLDAAAAGTVPQHREAVAWPSSAWRQAQHL